MNIIKKYKYFISKRHHLQYWNECDMSGGKIMGLDNVLTVILYTDFNNLSYQFRKVFRWFDDNGKEIDDKMYKSKHSEYANWGENFRRNNCIFW